MLEKNEVKIQRVTTKYKHTHTAFVEALNKILAERLFKVQDAQELNDPEKVSSRWVNPIRPGGLRGLDGQTHSCQSETSYPMMPKLGDF